MSRETSYYRIVLAIIIAGGFQACVTSQDFWIDTPQVIVQCSDSEAKMAISGTKVRVSWDVATGIHGSTGVNVLNLTTDQNGWRQIPALHMKSPYYDFLWLVLGAKHPGYEYRVQMVDRRDLPTTHDRSVALKLELRPVRPK